MYLTYLDSNSWLIEIANKRILLDPWLVDDLFFGNMPWLFRGKKLTQRPIPENIDLILLSQGLEDHAHPPTLKKLDRNLPVVASPNATKVVKELGYTQVTTLEHGEKFTLDKQIEIQAVPGSLIGLNLVENGYLIKNLEDSKTIYYEPHGNHSANLKETAPVDVVITPIISLKLPLVGAIIKGQESAMEVCKWLQPQVILPTATGGDIEFTGVLDFLLTAAGNLAQFQEQLQENKLPTKVVEATPGKRLAINLAD